jgi:hypothetical protein
MVIGISILCVFIVPFQFGMIYSVVRPPLRCDRHFGANGVYDDPYSVSQRVKKSTPLQFPKNFWMPLSTSTSRSISAVVNANGRRRREESHFKPETALTAKNA